MTASRLFQHVYGVDFSGARLAGRIRRGVLHIGAVRTPHAEVDQQFAPGGKHAACGLGGNQRLEVQNVDEARFDQLRLR